MKCNVLFIGEKTNKQDFTICLYRVRHKDLPHLERPLDERWWGTAVEGIRTASGIRAVFSLSLIHI